MPSLWSLTNDPPPSHHSEIYVKYWAITIWKIAPVKITQMTPLPAPLNFHSPPDREGNLYFLEPCKKKNI